MSTPLSLSKVAKLQTIRAEAGVAVPRYLAKRNLSIVIGGWALTNLSERERHERSFSATVHCHPRSALRLSNPSNAIMAIYGSEILPV